MDINFIPTEWSREDDLPYVLELVASMDLTPEQRAEAVRAWAVRCGFTLEVETIEGEV